MFGKAKNNPVKFFLACGTLSMLVAVILGAFCSHSLKHQIPFHAMIAFKTGVHYQIIHSLALILLGSLFDKLKNKDTEKILKYTGIFFILGILFFSGSLYLMTIAAEPNFQAALITPLGGLMFIMGWLGFFIAVMKSK